MLICIPGDSLINGKMSVCRQIRKAELHSGSIQVKISGQFSVSKVALSVIQQIDWVDKNNVTVYSSSLQLTIQT